MPTKDRTAGKRKCSRCSRWKLLVEDNFYVRVSRGKRYFWGYCKTCHNLAASARNSRIRQTPEGRAKYRRWERRWRQRNRSKLQAQWRRQDLKRKYGLTVKEYDLLSEKQKHQCAICGKPAKKLQRRLHVDHDHRTGAVRGLLCDDCNTGLGKFKDNPDFLIAAAEYLRRACRKLSRCGRASSLPKETHGQ